MSKKILIIFVLLIALMAVTLSACSNGSAPAKEEAPAQPTAAPAKEEAKPTEAPEPTKAPEAKEEEEVVLTLGSWRSDDVDQMNRILEAFHAEHPNITVKFDPTNPVEYDVTLRTQLEGGTAPDLFYLRSFSTSRQLFDEGFLEPLSMEEIPNLESNFTEAARAPWATDDGQPYGVPLMAVSHGIYYNQDLFKELGLEVPETWEDLIATAQKIKDAGYDPFANASGDEWTMAEIVFMNLAPTFIGGREGRLEYLSGDRCFNDEHAVAAFQAVADIAPYLPEGQEALNYYDSQQLFLMGDAAMWMGGSWDIPAFELEKPDFNWSVFAIPAPKGQDKEYVCFHMDAGIGLNAASEHKDAAKVFLDWVASEELPPLLANELPGFFPVQIKAPTIDNEHANTFLSLNEGRGLDVRWAWPVLLDGDPDGYTLMQNGSVGIVNGKMTPQEAADALQEGLAQWLEPAQNCKK